MASIKKHRTTILIDDDREPNDDWKFIEGKGFKPTHLLRLKIKELKEKEQGLSIDFEAANKKLHERLQTICVALLEVLGKEEFDKIMQKI